MKFQDVKIGQTFNHDGKRYIRIADADIWKDNNTGIINAIHKVNCLRLIDGKLSRANEWTYVEPM